MGFIKKITEDLRKHKTWIESLDDAVKRNDSKLLIAMLNNPDFEDGYDDILNRLGNFDDQEITELLYNYAISSKEELRDSAIKALFAAAERQKEIYEKLNSILKNELKKSNPNEDVLDIYQYRILFDDLPIDTINIFLAEFISVLEKNTLPKGNEKNLISIFGNLNRSNQLPYLLKKKQNDYFRNAVNSSLKKIGYKEIIRLIESKNDSNIKKMAIDELRYIRIDCDYNERVKDWDITEEMALMVLVKVLKDDNKSVQISAIKSIGYYGEFALEAVTELEPFLENEEKIFRVVTEKAIKRIISRDKVEANSLIEHYEKPRIEEEKNQLFDFNRENMYLITMLLSLIMNIGLIINQFFVLYVETKQIIGFIILGFLVLLIAFLLIISIFNWIKK